MTNQNETGVARTPRQIGSEGSTRNTARGKRKKRFVPSEELLVLKAGIGNGEYGEDRMVATGSPLIDESTCITLRRILDMDRNIILPATRERNPYVRASELTEDSFKYFCNEEERKGDRSGIVYQINSWLNQNHVVDSRMQDALCVGMMMVVAAYHTQCGPKFIDRLRDVPGGELLKAFNKTGSLGKDNTSIIGRAQSKFDIPETQPFLRSFFKELITNHVPWQLEDSVKDGAVVMFKVIDKLWPYLQSPQVQK